MQSGSSARSGGSVLITSGSSNSSISGDNAIARARPARFFARDQHAAAGGRLKIVPRIRPRYPTSWISLSTRPANSQGPGRATGCRVAFQSQRVLCRDRHGVSLYLCEAYARAEPPARPGLPLRRCSDIQRSGPRRAPRSQRCYRRRPSALREWDGSAAGTFN
jgi:hypothetical protein